jgi:hypothetical protein
MDSNNNRNNHYFFTNDFKPTTNSFLDIMGVGDHVRQQLDKKSVAKQKRESKNSQKVNDILKRLSTYTNKLPESKKPVKTKRKKTYRSSSMSSSSSIVSLSTKSSCSMNSFNEDSEEGDDCDSLDESCIDEDSMADFDENSLSNSEFSSFEEDPDEDFLMNDLNVNMKNDNVERDEFKMSKKEPKETGGFMIDEFEFNIKIDQNDSGICLKSTETATLNGQTWVMPNSFKLHF